MASQTFTARKRRVFNSVFGATSISHPTPVATPASGFTAPGQAFGGPAKEPQHQSLNAEHSDHVEDQVKWDRSWHLVTQTLHLYNFPEHRGILEPLRPERDSINEGFYHALENVLYPQVCLPFALQTEDIVVWLTSQTRNHFLHQVLPIIVDLKGHCDPETFLFRAVKILETAHRQYLHGLSFIKEQIDVSAPGAYDPIVARFRRDLHAVIANSVLEPLSGALAAVLRRQVATALSLPGTPFAETRGSEPEKARREILGIVETLRNVGLAGEKFQVIFADIMNTAMSQYIYGGCSGVWTEAPLTSEIHGSDSIKKSSVLPKAARNASPSRCIKEVCGWVETRYAKLAVQVLSMLPTKVSISWAEKEKYKEMSVGRLAELRTNELFEIVRRWPLASGALDDLRTAITTPQRRLHLTEVFALALGKNLLHPGASTLQILQTYISMIWSFHSLDHSKVLLDRVAYPLQLYLCSREDTVRIIITGLLADVQESHGNGLGPEKLIELAQLLGDGMEPIGPRASDEELDWHDMEWIPDPVDAGPGYKRSKNADIIGTLIGVLGSQEVFIKEFQNIIGDNFLKHDGAFEKEIKVLELLKIRFGEAPLQACEVMLKDIQDSGRVNGVIRRTQKLDSGELETVPAAPTRNMKGQSLTSELPSKPALHAKILSRLFWPQLQDETFVIPNDVGELQKQYEEGFESLKASRKLTWLHSLGQATVELELEDRNIVEEVHTWQATVIWAFQSKDGDVNVQRTTEQLVEHLEMDESLVRSALKFWVHKFVLHEVSPNTFAVLETLNQEDRERSHGQATTSAAANGDVEGVDDNGMSSQDGIGKEKAAVYWQFIQGMLKNSSPQMPLQQIAMMMKMLIADGFPYSNEELQEFLGRKVTEGELEIVGGKYRLKK